MIEIIVPIAGLILTAIAVVCWYMIRKLVEALIENSKSLIELRVEVTSMKESFHRFENDLRSVFKRVNEVESHVKSRKLS